MGVSESLGLTPVIKRIKLRQPWRALSPYLGFEAAYSFLPQLLPPWPDLVIASGRKSIAAARYIKRMSKGQTFTVQIQDPRISTKNFDLVAVPAHDPTRGENVIVTTAAPNRITPEKLAQAKKEFSHFDQIQSPRIAVLIGGSSQAYHLSPQIMQDIAQQLSALNGGLMITTSRRTGAQSETILKESLKNRAHYFWDGSSPNPYFALLAWADYILVTADSTSMLSEAATTGKPVYSLALPGGNKRSLALHRNLCASGAIRRFSGTLETWDYTPLNEAQKIATEITKRMAARTGLKGY